MIFLTSCNKSLESTLPLQVHDKCLSHLLAVRLTNPEERELEEVLFGDEAVHRVPHHDGPGQDVAAAHGEAQPGLQGHHQAAGARIELLVLHVPGLILIKAEKEISK